MIKLFQFFSAHGWHLLTFIRRVITRFFLENKGFLLAGAVGYNALLSIIPLLAIVLVALSYIFDEARIMELFTKELVYLIPGTKLSSAITTALREFMAERELIGWIGGLVLLFFSSLAFRMLEGAMEVIFKHHKTKESRHFLVSALIPYIYILVIGVAVGTLSIITGVLDARQQITLVGVTLSYARIEGTLLHVAAMLGLGLMLASIYMVLPTARVSLKRALIGGFTATLLWEIIRNFLVWYFENLSLASVVYGSLATVVIVLLSLEVGAAIILLGAQVIAELERNAELGVPWYLDPESETASELVSLDTVRAEREQERDAGRSDRTGTARRRPSSLDSLDETSAANTDRLDSRAV